MARIVWPNIEAVAARFANFGALSDRLQGERSQYQREEAAFRAEIEGKADAWMATAPYRDIALMQRCESSEAYDVVELLVLSALDGDSRLFERSEEVVEIFIHRVLENMRTLEREFDETGDDGRALMAKGERRIAHDPASAA